VHLKIKILFNNKTDHRVRIHNGQFSWGQNFPKFRPEKYVISAYTKRLFMEKWPKFARFSKKKNPNSQIFMKSSSRKPRV
jgi:hypothetical protein